MISFFNVCFRCCLVKIGKCVDYTVLMIMKADAIVNFRSQNLNFEKITSKPKWGGDVHCPLSSTPYKGMVATLSQTGNYCLTIWRLNWHFLFALVLPRCVLQDYLVLQQFFVYIVTKYMCTHLSLSVCINIYAVVSVTKLFQPLYETWGKKEHL